MPLQIKKENLPRCGSCHWYEFGSTPHEGKCRFYPPTVLLPLEPRLASQSLPQVGDSDWCSHHSYLEPPMYRQPVRAVVTKVFRGLRFIALKAVEIFRKEFKV